MPSKVFKQRRLLGWSPEQMYTVVSKVEDYNKFVPWCQQSRVTKPKANNYMEAELVVGFQMLTERYTSQVYLTPPNVVRSRVANSALFDHLDCTWSMGPGPTPTTCWLDFHVDFAFRSQLHGYLADLFFNEVVKQMVGAFEGRCAVLYGQSSLLSQPPRPRQQHHHAAQQQQRPAAAAAVGHGQGAAARVQGAGCQAQQAQHGQGHQWHGQHGQQGLQHGAGQVAGTAARQAGGEAHAAHAARRLEADEGGIPAGAKPR